VSGAAGGADRAAVEADRAAGPAARRDGPRAPPRPAAALAAVGLFVVAWNAGFLATRGANPWPAFVALGVAGLVTTWALRRGGLRAWLAPPGRLGRGLAVGLLAGALLVAATRLGFAWLAPHVPGLLAEVAALQGQAATALSAAALVPGILLVATAEELLFRGLLLDGLRAGRRPLLAVAVGSLVYAAAQLGAGAAALVVAAAALGAVWSALRLTTGGLLAPLLAHLAWTGSVLLFPLVR
jgi:hypothetical protein